MQAGLLLQTGLLVRTGLLVQTWNPAVALLLVVRLCRDGVPQ
jgi:hypothetical protein